MLRLVKCRPCPPCSSPSPVFARKSWPDMKYISTRGDQSPKHFCDILLEGLAPDGGLYLPAHYPQVDDAALSRLRSVYQNQGYAELAFEVLSLYIDDIPSVDLMALCRKTYTTEVFGSPEIVPLRPLENGIWL